MPIGILGGGQLARMLALSAHPLGLEVEILTARREDPAAQVCANVHLGSLSDKVALKSFLKRVGCLTFESEFVDTALVARCLPAGKKVFPALTVIEAIQDRLTQKRLLDRFKIVTSPWLEVNDRADLLKAGQRFTQGFVLKQRRFGYDGNGTFVFRNPQVGDAAANILKKSTYGFIAEEFIPFQKELATSFVRSRSGDFLSLPLVESVQRDQRCFSVHGPVKHAQSRHLTSQFQRLMQTLDYHGILAVELFQARGQLLVNELAPRVHNSAHYSMDGLTCDQFEYHLRAGLGLPLPKVELLRPGFAMVNLLGEDHKTLRLSRSAAGKLHWYGKADNRTGRKLGHINTLAPTGPKALQRALRWRRDFQL